MTVEVYGFGSFFDNKNCFQDIDLLLLYPDFSKENLTFVISCKRLILAQIPKADIVMLSKNEDEEVSFKKKSKAKLLTIIKEDVKEYEIDNIVNRILFQTKKQPAIPA